MKVEPSQVSCANLVQGSTYEFYVTLLANRPQLQDPRSNDPGQTVEVVMRDKSRALLAVSVPTAEMDFSSKKDFEVTLLWGEEQASVAVSVSTTSLEEALNDERSARMRHPSANSNKTRGNARRRIIAEWAAGTIVVPSAAAACAQLAMSNPVATQAWAIALAMLGIYPAASTRMFFTRPTRLVNWVLRPYCVCGQAVMRLIGLADTSARPNPN